MPRTRCHYERSRMVLLCELVRSSHSPFIFNGNRHPSKFEVDMMGAASRDELFLTLSFSDHHRSGSVRLEIFRGLQGVGR